MKPEKAELQEHAVNIDYDSYNLDEALRIVLPADIPEIPSAFETIGHIARLNLKAWHLPYKHIIGQMMLDVRLFQNATHLFSSETYTYSSPLNP